KVSFARSPPKVSQLLGKVSKTFLYHLSWVLVLAVSDTREVGSSGDRQVFVDKCDRHAPFAHAASYTLDRTVTDVARTKYARKTRLQRKRLTIKRPSSQVSTGANIAFHVALKCSWKP